MVDLLEKQGKEVSEKDIEAFRQELYKNMSNPDQPIDPLSMQKMQEKAAYQVTKATGNAKLAFNNVPNIKI